jgi:hypothetical protein
MVSYIWLDVKSPVGARRVAQNAIALAVREARAADWSWDKTSTALGGTPERRDAAPQLRLWRSGTRPLALTGGLMLRAGIR